MDQNENYSSQNVSKFSQVHFLKKTIQILVSIYVISLLFCQPSLLNAMMNYLDHYISSFSIKLFHYNTERNCVFLLFNGILAVILKSSGLISESRANSGFEDSRKEKIYHSPEVSDAEFSRTKTKVVKKAEEHARQHGISVTVNGGEEFSERKTEFTKEAVMEVEEDGRQKRILVKDGINELQTAELNDKDQDDEKEEEHGLMSADELNRKCDDERQKRILVKDGRNELQTAVELNDEDQDDDKEEEHGLMSADELNRKCDEFIKKVRQGIKIEFQNNKCGLNS